MLCRPDHRLLLPQLHRLPNHFRPEWEPVTPALLLPVHIQPQPALVQAVFTTFTDLIPRVLLLLKLVPTPNVTTIALTRSRPHPPLQPRHTAPQPPLLLLYSHTPGRLILNLPLVKSPLNAVHRFCLTVTPMPSTLTIPPPTRMNHLPRLILPTPPMTRVMFTV